MAKSMKSFNSSNKGALILLIVLLAWAVFSLVYIGYDTWTDFKAGQMNQAYQQGRVDTVNNLISRAQKDCQPFSVNSQNNKINLIDVSCLQQQGSGQGAQQGGGAQQPMQPQQ